MKQGTLVGINQKSTSRFFVCGDRTAMKITKIEVPIVLSAWGSKRLKSCRSAQDVLDFKLMRVVRT